MAKILPQPGISQIELYQGGSSHIEGVSNVVKLSSNENPFGPSETAIAVFGVALSIYIGTPRQIMRVYARRSPPNMIWIPSA